LSTHDDVIRLFVFVYATSAPKTSRTDRNAEFGAAYLCAEAGVSNEVIRSQASYVAGWLAKWRARHFSSYQQEILM